MHVSLHDRSPNFVQVRLDRKKDVLIVQTYLVDAEVPFLYGKQTLESWNFKIDGEEKILEIQLKSGQDNGRKLIKMEETRGSLRDCP